MRKALVPELRCPHCGEGLDLSEGQAGVDGEIVAGSLECRSRAHRFAIEAGVPNLLREPVPGEKVSHFGDQWRWFLSGKFEDPNVSNLGEDRAFILQDFWEMTGLTPDTLRGMRILDAGSGSSKIAYHLTQVYRDVPFEIVCLEVTDAVYAASRRFHDERVEHVRGSVFHPGLRAESFDVVYSAGVLHHTPDPRGAFDALVPLVKPGGVLSTWMYSKRFNPFLDVTGLVWPLTRRLPVRIILGIAYAMAPAFWLLFRAGHAYKKIVAPTSWRWKWVLPLSLASIRLHLFDYMHTYYRFRYWPEEVVPWYERHGFTDITVLRPGSTAMHARKPVSPRAAVERGALTSAN